MKKMITLQLPDLMVGQILDGLERQRDIWWATARYHATGILPDDCLAFECSDEEEAVWIADFYEEIVCEIRSQIRT